MHRAMEFERFPFEFDHKIGNLLGEFWLGDTNIRNIIANRTFIIRAEISYPAKDGQYYHTAMDNYTMQLEQLIKQSSDAGRQLYICLYTFICFHLRLLIALIVRKFK